MSLTRRIGRQKKEPQRAAPCIFCDQPRGSKEHFWPEWMHPLLPSHPDLRYNREVIDYHPETGVERSGRVGAQGAVQTIQIRAVCRDCNNGWMNRLEAEARPLLTPLITGEPVALDHEQTTSIARWIATKCMVSEHAAPNRALTPKPDRVRFRETREIPPYFHIYLGSHHGHHVAYRRNCHLISLTRELDPPLGPGASKNIQVITFYMGRVFAHVIAARIHNFQLESRVPIPALYERCRIWPPDHFEMVWPQTPAFSQRDVGLFSLSLDAYLNASTITWDARLGRR